MRNTKFKISNYRTKTQGTVTLAYERAPKEREIFCYVLLKSKSSMIKKCMIWVIKPNDIL